MLLSIPENIVKHFSRRVVGQIQSKSLMLMPEQLDRIEKDWTGHDRTSIPFNLGQTSFYTVITITSYMTVRWEQVRELAVIALAEDAFDILITESGLKPGWGKAKRPIVHDLDRDQVIFAVSNLKSGSIRHNLLAAIRRIAFYFKRPPFHLQSLQLYEDDGITWELVNYAYKLFKRGRLEPTEPFLRISTQMDIQSINNSYDGPFDHWENLEVSPSSAVLLHGAGHFHDVGKKMQSSICVYLVGEHLGIPSQDNLATIIKGTFEDFDVYHTTRDNGKMSLKERKDGRAPWNLSNSYGLHFSYGDSSFPKWLRVLNAAIPTRQGSPRGPLLGGNMLERQYTPWHDPRLIHDGYYARMRLIFLRKLVTLEYRIWGRIAQERQDVGICCCVCCATLLNDPHVQDHLCDDCDMELENSRYPKWFGKQLKKNLRRMPRPKMEDSSQKWEPPIEYSIGTPEIRPLPSSFFAPMEEDINSNGTFDPDFNLNDQVGSDSELSTTGCILRIPPVPRVAPGEASFMSTPSPWSRKRKRPE